MWADALCALLLLAHLAATVAWLGEMLYSLVVVQPRLASFFANPRQREEL